MTPTPEIIFHTEISCPYCGQEFSSMVILRETPDQSTVAHVPFQTDECPHCGAEMDTSETKVEVKVRINPKKKKAAKEAV